MKVGVVGAGFVGATAGFAMVMDNVPSELVFIDKDEAKAEGEAMDVSHAAPFSHPVRVSKGNYRDLANAALVVIAAGANQKPGETRLDLAAKNAAIFRSIVPQIVENAPNAILLVVTNPVDVLTHVAWEASGLPRERVIGSGTTLDTARLRSLVGAKARVSPQNVHGYVLGEHGDSEFVAWSSMDIAGLALRDYFTKRHIPWDEDTENALEEDVRRAAYEIIRRKEATYYGVATAISQIVESILQDQQRVLTVSMSDGEVAYSLPRVLGGQGVIATLDLNFNDREQQALEHSIGVIREAIESVGPFEKDAAS
ncbi:MAG: L-lactate dehydrogenase [Trueperaceae bacterium]|nr:L-lactate dehydrogenase [Trueperaceae bacterium]